MLLKKDDVCLGPYTRNQKLYLELDDGLKLEGRFYRFNNTKTGIQLHEVELVPPDGRVLDKFLACLDELVCLRPLEPPKEIVKEVVEKKCDRVNGSLKVTNENEPSSSSSEESSPSRPKLTKAQMLRETIKTIKKVKFTTSTPAQATNPNGNDKKENFSEAQTPGTSKLSDNKDCTRTNSREKSINVESKPNVIHIKEDGKLEASFKLPDISDPVYEEMKKKALGHIVIDKLGPDFTDAMKDIEEQTILGIGSHGAEQGRRSRLSFLTVATEKAVYLIDIQTLGKHVWHAGLQKALESRTVEKVTYDCRLLADCLLYVHKVHLENVFDIQAADCVINRCRVGKFVGRARSLAELVSQYLDLPAALLTDTVKITNFKVWYQRPLPSGCHNYAAWLVVFLPQLRKAMGNAFMAPLLRSFDLYLNHVRPLQGGDATEAQRSRQPPTDRLELLFSRDNY